MTRLLLLVTYFCLTMPGVSLSGQVNDAAEPSVEGANAVDLLAEGSVDVWDVPASGHWHVGQESIVGHTGEVTLGTPEWIYTKERFGDFEFTCELKLTGDTRRNTGIYFRVNKIRFENKRGTKSYEAPSGYEFDAAFHSPGKRTEVH